MNRLYVSKSPGALSMPTAQCCAQVSMFWMQAALFSNKFGPLPGDLLGEMIYLSHTFFFCPSNPQPQPQL